MMQQYVDIKREHMDYILMYRLGDFYEMFFEDAVKASRELELTLTARDCGDDRRAAMCGVPFHKVDVYVARLVEKGYRVAICEQTEDPSAAKGLVRREVIRAITPGTITDGSMLADNRNNYLAAMYYTEEYPAVAFADVSTGQVYVTIPGDAQDALRLAQSEIGNYAPKEVVLNLNSAESNDVVQWIVFRSDALVTDNMGHLYDENKAYELAVKCFGEEKTKALPKQHLLAIGALLGYIQLTQKTEPTFLRDLHIYTGEQHLELDQSTFRNLELLETMRDREKKGTLLWVLDHTCTAMGARELRNWIRQPLRKVAPIVSRQKAVEELFGNFMLRESLRELLSTMLDIERLVAKAAFGSANARDLRSLADSLKVLPQIKQLVGDTKCNHLQLIWLSLDPLQDICKALDEALVENPPLTIREGGMIKGGYSQEIDRYREIAAGGKEWMHDIEEREAAATGIRNLRVGYNKVFGFFIEVSKGQSHLVPAHYVRRQTLTNCERYITEELKEMENTVLSASDKLCALEYEMFCQLRDMVDAHSARVQKTAAVIAGLDVLTSLADVAAKNNYVCPEVDDSDIIDIRDGRHPVVEKFTTGGYFVPNDTKLDTKSNRLMLITGPNMAGKSTYMRQVALIVLMAQIGSFVPAAEARVGVVDRIFTRVGASDDLASGQSTFMLEMTEVASILQRATKQSLIIYDEVGRGTSTYDGMSIARAVVEYTASPKLGARTMFATHYHELTELEGICEGVINYHIVAKKRNDDIIFLRKIARGATDDSYGIEVAKLAGVPAEVVKRAREVLKDIESEGSVAPAKRLMPKAEDVPVMDMFTALRQSEADEIADILRHTDLDTLTPIEAMNLLFSLKKKLSTN
ncbi:MAG: DNA mismatch repair protein MutS [Clostridia bacterium]|nr:DNA mismatch repair protein MutS [Clostridia bacterium]